MAKINLSDRKFVVLIAALLSSTLAFIILRSLLTNPGIIEAIDIQWNQNFAMFEYFFHTWNFYNNGSNIIFASQFPIYGWVLVFRDVALAQRFVYFLTVSLISFNMFLVAFYTLKRTTQHTLCHLFGFNCGKSILHFKSTDILGIISYLFPLGIFAISFSLLFWVGIIQCLFTSESFGKCSSLKHVLCLYGGRLGYAGWFTYPCYCCNFKRRYEWAKKSGSSVCS